jgi:hypothetical protein
MQVLEALVLHLMTRIVLLQETMTQMVMWIIFAAL